MMYFIINTLIHLSLILLGVFILPCLLISKIRRWGRRRSVVGFFHPYCNAGGGGERVLWCAIRALQNKYPDIECIIYTGDCDATSEEIIAKAKDRFNIVLPRPVKFVFLFCRNYVEAKNYPFLTLIGQALGSVILGLEALIRYIPDIYLDSMGYPFTMFVFWCLGWCRVGCYVHYPVISTDMIDNVASRVEEYNNASNIARSESLTKLKLTYYRLFAFVYGLVGRFSEVTMVNSTWTFNHIQKLWGTRPHLVYPPCDIDSQPFQDNTDKEIKTIISVSQFRPEKNHELQLQAFAKLLERTQNVRLILIGSCRNVEDAKRIQKLKDKSKDLGIDDLVDFRVNIPFSELQSVMRESNVGIHTMWNEHFGIGIVEMMSCGIIMVAHRSGGPMLDIIDDETTGYLADTPEQYAQTLHTALMLNKHKAKQIKLKARSSMERFSVKKFEESFLRSVQVLFS